MPSQPSFLCLAVDLGAESGRVAAVLLQGRRLSLRVLHRFEHEPRLQAGILAWDLDALWAGILRGLEEAAKAGLRPRSVGVDGWGVDHVLVDEAGRPTQPAHCYRDTRGARGLSRLRQRIRLEELYPASGLGFQPFNTLSQLEAESPAALAGAQRLMLLPDHLHERLCGVAVAEQSNASTTQLREPRARRWNSALMERLGLPARLFPPLAEPGTVLGPVLPALAERLRLPGLQVALPATHDTASAVAAVPALSPRGTWAFVSSGTWSLMGLELDAPVLSQEAAAYGMSNEGGVDGTTRFLRNLSGLWLLQRLRAELAPGLPYGELMALAQAAPAFRAVFDIEDASLLNPPSMAEAIRALCGAGAPTDLGGLARVALESLALEYRRSLGLLQRLSGCSVERLHIVGGGCQNELLNRMTADACGLPVVAGPVEATALGNALMQARAFGRLEGLEDARRVVAASVPLKTFVPAPSPAWESAYRRYLSLKESRPHARA
jgi:rhamnulokinase